MAHEKSIQERLDNILFDHSLWLNELYYSLKEISIYEKRLLTLIKIYFGKEEQEELGTMLSAFGNHREIIERIRNQVEGHITSMKKKVASNGELNSLSDSGHSKSRKSMEDFRKSYSKLKSNFHRFAAVSE